MIELCINMGDRSATRYLEVSRSLLFEVWKVLDMVLSDRARLAEHHWPRLQPAGTCSLLLQAVYFLQQYIRSMIKG